MKAKREGRLCCHTSEARKQTSICVFFFSCENVNEELGPDDDKRYQWLQAARAQPAPRSFAPASYGVCQSSSSSPELRRRPTGCGLCRLRCDWPAARGLCYLLWNMFSSHPEIVPGTRAWPCPVHNYITASRKVPCLFALCAHGEQTGKKKLQRQKFLSRSCHSSKQPLLCWSVQRVNLRKADRWLSALLCWSTHHRL